jgi:hypothetical protein
MMPESRNSGPKGMAIARQWLGKHIPVAADTHATIEELLDKVSFVRSMLKLYNG